MSIDELGARQRLDAARSAEDLAVVAAEVVAMIEHHRDELQAAMAELTALQRTVRSEIRDAIHELDRIASGAEVSEQGSVEPVGSVPDQQSRRFRRPFRR
jgi:acyl-CoA reductase-like NAD-dependent aldehyde dehydrogenase